MATAKGLATLIWVLLFFGTLAFYFVLFTLTKKKPRKVPDVTFENKNPIIKDNALITSYSPPPSGTDVEGAPSAPVRSLFGQRMVEEYMFNNEKTKTFYSVGIDKEMIKVTRIWSRLGKQSELAFGSNPTLFRRTLATAEFTTDMKSAPIALFTHIESYAEGSRPSPWKYFKMWFWNWWLFFEHNLLFWMCLLMSIAVIMSFYVPGSMDTSTSGANRAELSYSLTVAIFVFTVLVAIFNLLYLRACRAKNSKQKTADQSAIHFVSFLFLLIALGLSTYLLYVAYADRTGDNKPSNDTMQSALDSFTCFCPANNTSPSANSPSPEPTFIPTNSPNGSHLDNSYSFVCTADQDAAADYNACDMNCGVCGDQYYQPFVSYATFAGVYLLLILYLAFEAWFAGHIFLVGSALDENYDANTHMVVTIHGSESFGYPLYTRLGLGEALLLEEYLSNYSEREQGRRNGDFLNHMKSVGSNIVEQTVVKKTSKTVEYVAKFLIFVVRLGFRLVGIPL